MAADKEVHQEEDADGNLVLTIEYTDGTLSDPFTILKGQTGVGIEEIIETDNEDGSIDLVILYTDGNSKDVHIPAPKKGEDGIGIVYIESSQDDHNYYLIVHYSDGSKSDPIPFERGSIWIQVTEKPNDSVGQIGDYAFDTAHKIIYLKHEDGHWYTEVDFGIFSEVEHIVTFNGNGQNSSVIGANKYTVKHGETFYQNHLTVPKATRPGYIFNGWSTSPSHDCTNGVFTDLTPVLSAMELYAIWSEE